MGSEILSIFMNFMMTALLLATIVYCLKLNRRIVALQDSKSELASIIREFDESTKRATQSINEIHAATTRISENIQHKIDKASFLADDLEVMIERGNKMAGKLDPAYGRQHRPEVPPAATAPKRSLSDILPTRAPETAASEPPTEAEAPARRPLRMRSRAEQELMNLIGRKNNTDQKS